MIQPSEPTGKHVPATLNDVIAIRNNEKTKYLKTCPYKSTKVATHL